MQNRINPELDVQKSVDIICNFIKEKLSKSKSEGLVIGLSGGIDSTVVAYLCARAVSNDKIMVIVLPSETASPGDVKDAISVANELNIEYKVLKIDDLIKPFPHICPGCSSDLANGNLKARIRMIILYYHSNSMNRLVVGTGNKTELLIGYFTKYGDGGVDILPIGNLYKTGVKKIAAYLGVSKKIIEKAPAAGLWAGQTDEEELGIKYELLDKILYLLIDKNLSTYEVSEYLKIPHKEVLRIKNMVESSKHKLSPPPIAEVK